VAAWRGRAVVSTLAAFGGSDAAVDNLRRLHAGGVTVLYGTDLGNSQVAGVDPRELVLLAAAGLSTDEILAALTRRPAAYWGFADLGTIAVSAPANLVLLAADPLASPATLAAPTRVFLDGAAAR
jgi:imidazolonepropionase-like amidohydrolase